MARFFLYYQSSVHYILWGTGKKILLCFHGYGEDSSSFSFLQDDLTNEFTILAFDLPFHGKTTWHTLDSFNAQTLFEIIDGVLKYESLERYDLYFLGYSMGGRMVLQLAELNPYVIRKMVLIAPDGLEVNNWYWLATQTTSGIRLFQYIMNQPSLFLKMISVGKKLGLVNNSVSKFVHHYLDDEQMRRDLYTRWTALRKIKPHLGVVQKNIVRYKISTRFLYGKYDRIILSHRAEKFCKPLKDLAVIKIIPAGHQLMQEKYMKDIIQLIDQ